MGNDASPRPGYDTWISFRGQGQLVDPEFFEDGALRPVQGYVTDLLNARVVAFIEKPHDRPFALFLAHKAVHPDLFQAQDGTIDLTSLGGYLPAARHSDLYRGCYFPPRPNVLQPGEVVRQKPAWREAFALKASERSQLLLRSVHAGTQEEIRCRAAMMASVDEGVGMLLAALTRQGMLEHTCIVFLGDNGYFFGEHALGPERRFAYEEGIRSPFLMRYPPLIAPGTVVPEITLALDIAPTCVELAGGTPGPHIQGRSLVPLLSGLAQDWRTSFLIEYYSESAMPWLVGMTYKAVRTTRHKLIHWVHHNDCDELYDLEQDPYELQNYIGDPVYQEVRDGLYHELARLVAGSVSL